MSDLNFKDFLTSGAFLQTGADDFKVFIGPFRLVDLNELDTSESTRFLYRSNFWDFLENSNKNAQNFVYKATKCISLNRVEFIDLLSKQKSLKPSLSWLDVEESGFKKQFDWSFNLFQKQVLKKTVPIILQKSKTNLEIENKVWILNHLLAQSNFGWSYGFFDNASGFIGHTPESLVVWNLKNKKAETMALAGTLAKTETAKYEILQDQKIMQEHNYVVEDVEKKLKFFEVANSKIEALELKHLVHLKTDFSFKAESLKDVFTAIEHLHPTAAMGVFPYDQQRLAQLSEFDLQQQRGAFAAPFGLMSKNEAQIVVGIRNLIFSNNEISLFSGCGITQKSHYAAELNELENKRNSVKKMLGLNND